MSDSAPVSQGDDAPASGALPADAPASEAPGEDVVAPGTVTLESVTCPSCEAVLRNVRIEGGATLRCLNCGKRFRPVLAGSTDSQPILAEGVEATAAAPAREPGSVGYWLLRIPATVLLAGACLATALICYFNLRYFRARFEEIVFASYLPLIPWIGAFLFLLSRSLARLDAGGVRSAWRSGALKGAIPPVPGSSLPYVAPIAIAGGVLPVICVRAEPGSIEAALVGTLIGGALFYVGFAFEDLRQFIWRQEYLARACCRDYGIDDSAERYGSGASWSGTFLGGAALCFGLGILMAALDMMRGRTSYRAILIPLYAGVALMAVSYSLYLLNRDWDRAINWWQLARWAGKFRAAGVDAAEKLKSNRSPWEPLWTPPPVEHDLSSAVRLATWVPRLWAGWGVVWLAAMFIRHAPNGGSDFFGVISFCAFGAALAFWLSFFLPQLARWRGAQESVWMLRGKSSDSGGSGVRNAMFWSAIIVVAAEAMLFGAMMINQWSRWGRWRFEEVAAFPLLMVMMHFPTVWLALTLREFLKLEGSCGEKRNGIEN